MDNRSPIEGRAKWGTGQGRIHLVHPMTGCCLGCKKKVGASWGSKAETEMTVDEVRATDFGMCSFVSNFWLDRFTEEAN